MVSVYVICEPAPCDWTSYWCSKCTSHSLPRLRSRRASVWTTNRFGLATSVTTDRSWNVPLKFDPVDVNVVPTDAEYSDASRERSLNVSSAALSPDHSRCARRSAMTSNTASGAAVETTDVRVRNSNLRSAIVPPRENAKLSEGSPGLMGVNPQSRQGSR